MNILLEQEAKRRYEGAAAGEEKTGKKGADDAPAPAASGAAVKNQAPTAAAAMEPFAAAATAATAPFAAAAAPSGPAPAPASAGGMEMHEAPAYSGKYSSEVSQLLKSSPSPWKAPSCITCNDGVPPKVPESLPCQRDSYVYAALTAAWGAESYARVGEAAKAESTAALVRQNLDNADSLCSNAPSVAPGASCVTLDIWPCKR